MAKSMWDKLNRYLSGVIHDSWCMWENIEWCKKGFKHDCIPVVPPGGHIKHYLHEN